MAFHASSLGVRLFREPDGNLPVRFDEREQETESSQTGLRRRRESFVSSHRETKATAPFLDSTRKLTASKNALTSVNKRHQTPLRPTNLSLVLLNSRAVCVLMTPTRSGVWMFFLLPRNCFEVRRSIRLWQQGAGEASGAREVRWTTFGIHAV